MGKLTDQQLEELFIKYEKTKDIDVRNDLLNNFLYIAEIIAKKFIGRGVEYDDLLQVAYMALVKAIDRYDISRGIKFTSFATPSLIGEIKNYFRDNTRLLHISRKDSEQLLKLAEARNKLSALGENVTPEAIADVMGVSEEYVLELMEMQAAANVAPLESTNSDGESFSIGDILGEHDTGYEDIENRDFIKKCMSKLNDDEKTILIERFWNKRSQKQVADILGVSQMNISRAEKKILGKLRTYYNND